MSDEWAATPVVDESPVPRSRRLRVLAALVVLVAGGLVADRLVSRTTAATGDRARVAAMPEAAPPTALSSTWFCAGGTAAAGGAADGTVVVANAGDRKLSGTVRVVPSEGEAKTVPITVGPNARAVVRLADVVNAPYAAALVELDGGDYAVDHEVSGPLGFSTSPCSPVASEQWHLAEGSTAREDTMLLALFNPFPEDAIVDLAFATDQGRAVPAAFTGLVVRGGGLSIVNVGEHVRRRNHIAMTATARSGRLVVDRIQLRNGTVKGLSVALASPTDGDLWYFPEGLVADGISEQYHLYNPTPDEAQVSIELTLQEGSAEPFDLTIPPRERVTVVAGEEERVPRGVGHAATVRSLNDVPVVAERTVTAGPPAGRAGTVDTLGLRSTARDWLLASGSATEAMDEWVVVLNPGTTEATVSVRALAAGQVLPIESLQSIRIPPGQRAALRMGDHIRRDDLPLTVSATVPVVVERGMYRVGSIGIALSAGVPLRR